MNTDTLVTALRRLKKGTAAGPFGNLTDTLRSFALFQPQYSTTMPYLKTFSKILHLILTVSLFIPGSTRRGSNTLVRWDNLGCSSSQSLEESYWLTSCNLALS